MTIINRRKLQHLIGVIYHSLTLKRRLLFSVIWKNCYYSVSSLHSGNPSAEIIDYFYLEDSVLELSNIQSAKKGYATIGSSAELSQWSFMKPPLSVISNLSLFQQDLCHMIINVLKGLSMANTKHVLGWNIHDVIIRCAISYLIKGNNSLY